MDNSINNTQQATELTKVLCGEFFRALGFSERGLLSKILSPLVRNSIHKFSVLASGFDQRIEGEGFQGASQWMLPHFIDGIHATGTDQIPKNGPLLVASNHPGAYDALVIAAKLPRDDLKIVVNIPLDFISELPHTLPHFLYAPLDPHIRMNVVRSAIKHLDQGGSLLVFASGGMDPDPASMHGAETVLASWSRSLEIFLRRVPNTQLLLTIVSGILSPKYVHHFFTRFRKNRVDKQRISEFFQLMRQMNSPGILKQTPSVTFDKPIRRELITNDRNAKKFMDAIEDRARSLLFNHGKTAGLT